MKWFKENKFLAGLLIFTLLGVGALGYLLITAKGKYEENRSIFEQQAAELHRLETLPAYPDKQNLEVLEAQRVAHLGLIDDLQKSLASAELPVEAITPNGFQDQLGAAVKGLAAKADAASPAMKLPEKGFYLGFNPYQAAPPTPEAAPLLSRELKVIQIVTQVLLDSHVSALKDITRQPLPEESKAKPVAMPPPKPGAKKPGAPAEPLVKTNAVDVTFTSDQKAFRDVLNALTSNKDQFLIPRYVSVHNQVDRSPPKEVPVADANGGAPAPDAAADGKAAKSPMIFGEEKVDVTIRLEIVDFAAPSSGSAKPGRPSPAK